MYWIYGGLNGDDFYDASDYNNGYRDEYYQQSSAYVKDPYFYHTDVTTFATIKHESKTCSLMNFKFKKIEFDVWIPNKLIKKNNSSIYVHTEIGMKQIVTKIAVSITERRKIDE